MTLKKKNPLFSVQFVHLALSGSATQTLSLYRSLTAKNLFLNYRCTIIKPTRGRELKGAIFKANMKFSHLKKLL